MKMIETNSYGIGSNPLGGRAIKLYKDGNDSIYAFRVDATFTNNRGSVPVYARENPNFPKAKVLLKLWEGSIEGSVDSDGDLMVSDGEQTYYFYLPNPQDWEDGVNTEEFFLWNMEDLA